MSGSFKKKESKAVVLKATLSPQPIVIGSPVTAKLPNGKLGNLQFTRTMLNAPFTKTNIAEAVGYNVNSLSFTPLTQDAAFDIGVDATTISSTTGGKPSGGNPARKALNTYALNTTAL